MPHLDLPAVRDLILLLDCMTVSSTQRPNTPGAQRWVSPSELGGAVVQKLWHAQSKGVPAKVTGRWVSSASCVSSAALDADVKATKWLLKLPT